MRYGLFICMFVYKKYSFVLIKLKKKIAHGVGSIFLYGAELFSFSFFNTNQTISLALHKKHRNTICIIEGSVKLNQF